MTTIYHYHHPAPWKKHIIWKHIEIADIFFSISNLPTYQVFSISVNGAPSLHLLRPKMLASSLTCSSLMCHIQPIKKSHWLCFQNTASIRPVLKVSSATSQAQPTIIYVLNYCSSILTGLWPLVFLLVDLLFIQRPMILLKYISDQITAFLKTFRYYPISLWVKANILTIGNRSHRIYHPPALQHCLWNPFLLLSPFLTSLQLYWSLLYLSNKQQP